MSTLSEGLCDALEAEHQCRAEAAAAVVQFGSIPVFVHLAESAERHVETLTGVLRRGGIEIPPRTPATITSYESPAEALEAAFGRQTRTAELYDRLLEGCSEPELRRVLFNLWQSSSHRHRSAIAHRLRVEHQGNGR